MTRLASAFLVTASALAFAAPAMAASTTLYASDANLARAANEGQRVTQVSGVTQIRLESGGTASFVAGASFQIRLDGSIDLFSGTVTVASGDGAPVVVHLADRGEGRVSGRGSAASFSVGTGKDGRNEAKGHVLTGTVIVVIGTGSPRSFNAGQMWDAADNRAQLAVANGAAAVPAAGGGTDGGVEPMGGEDGAVAAATNGIPVVLGDALAAAGASGDVIAAARRVQAASANPSIESYPSGDLALLVAYAGNLNGAYGGRPFNGAAADIIRTYLQFLAGGGTQVNFLGAYAGFMVQYLDLIRSGALPSSFRGANLAQINSFISYRGRTVGFGALSGQNKVLIEAYLAFIQGGGSADQFLVRYTDLTTAYFAFIRGGGSPAAFTGASQTTITAYLTFLRDAGLLANLTAQNQALLTAYLNSLSANGNGLAFADSARVSLNAYYIFLQQGRLPSTYAAADLAALRQYLETLKATGLFDQTLGSQASFFNGYLVWLQGGGAVDGYGQLPANVFAGYATALNAYYAFLRDGGLPTAYTALTQEQIRIYLAALEGAGATARFTGDLGTFWAQYYAWIAAANNPDLFAGLPTVNYPAFATALNAYYVYIAGGGLPGNYTAVSLEQLRIYINALIAAGRLGDLGSNATFLQAYFTYLGGGGAPNGYSQLPVYINYQTALNAYYAYLQGGGLPGAYTALTPAQLQAYLQALINSGVYSSLFSGQTATFLTAYYNFVNGGGSPNSYTGLPAYTTYVSALNAYYIYLQGGGLPGSYTGLNLAQLQAYLQALIDAGILGQFFTGTTLTFFQGYYTYVAGGGTPNNYSGLATITGGTGGTGGTNTNLAYTGGFPSSGTHAIFTATGSNGGGRFSNQSISINANGALTDSTSFTPQTATAVDVGGDSRGLVGRFTNGTVRFGDSSTLTYGANGGMPYVIMAPIIGSMPTTGTVSYAIMAATKPTYDDGHTAPGTFAASLMIGLSNLNYAIDGSITMPDATYTVTAGNVTTGSLVAPQVASSTFYGIRPSVSAGPACPSGCQLNMFGAFGGSNPQERVGFAYHTIGSPTGKTITGSVLFGQNGTFTPAGSGSGGGSQSTQAAPTGSDIWVRSVGQSNVPGTSNRYAQGSFYSNSPGSVTADADGKLQTGELSAQPLVRVTASNVDYGTAAGQIGWTRWTGGTVRHSDNTLSEVPTNGGLSFIWGKPVTNMPTTGTVNYELAGSTKPSLQSGAAAPGTLNSASFSVNFGAMTADFSASVSINGNNYTAASASPMPIATNGTFSNFNSSSHILGFLAGPGASHAGVTYNLFGPGVSGVVAFAKPGI